MVSLRLFTLAPYLRTRGYQTPSAYHTSRVFIWSKKYIRWVPYVHLKGYEMVRHPYEPSERSIRAHSLSSLHRSSRAAKCIPIDVAGTSPPIPSNACDVREVAHGRSAMRAMPWLIHCPHVLHNLMPGQCLPRCERVSELTDVICRLFNAVPIMMLFLHARIANIARALEHRTICPAGRSCIRWRSSSRSANARHQHGS